MYRRTSNDFLAILLLSAIVLHVTGELFEQTETDSYSNLYPFIEKWARGSHSKMLTVVFDDYEPHNVFHIPRNIIQDLNLSIKLVSLGELISLKNRNPSRDYQSIESGNCVLLFFSDLEHLRDILSSPHLISFWQPENWYILQERRQRFSDSSYHERFCKWAFERLWRFRKVYKLLLFTGDKVIRYDPFEYAGRHVKYYVNSSCDWYCVKSNEDSFLLINEPNSTDVSDFFDEERKDFKMCPLKISIFRTTTMPVLESRSPGLDFKYLEEVCRMMNVTPVLVKSKDKHGWAENGVFYGTLGHLVYKFADVSFNQYFIKDYLTRQVEFTTAITNDKLCVLVPKAPPVPDYLVIFKIFSRGAWILIFISYFLISVIYTVMRTKMDETTGDCVGGDEKEFFNADFHTKSYVSGDGNCIRVKIVRKTTRKERCMRKGGKNASPARAMKGSQLTAKGEKKPLKRFIQTAVWYLAPVGKYLTKVVLQLVQPYKTCQVWFPERLFLMCSLLLSLILNGVFTSQLASTFSKRMYYKDIDTLEELEESGLPILTNSRDIIEDALTDSTSPVIKRLHKRLQYANESEVDRRLFHTKDAAYLHRLAPVTLKYNKNQRERLHVVKECPKEYILTEIVTKGSPFRGRINSILGRLNNGGFYWKWYQSLFQSQRRAADEVHVSTMHRKITVRHLFIPLAILLIGLATSLIVFICECRQNSVH